MADNERILNLIKNLLNKTVENGCTEEEATSAAEKAQELLFKYNLETIDVDNYKKQDDKGIESDVFKAIFRDKKFAYRPFHELIFSVSEYNFCKGYVIGDTWARFVGRKTDIIVAKEIFEYVTDQILRLADEATKKYSHDANRWKQLHERRHRLTKNELFEYMTFIPEGVSEYWRPPHGTVYKNSFILGIVYRVIARMRANFIAMSNANDDSTALVLVTANAIKEWTDENLKKVEEYEPKHTRISEKGYIDGHIAGDKVDIGQPKKRLDS